MTLPLIACSNRIVVVARRHILIVTCVFCMPLQTTFRVSIGGANEELNGL